MNFNEDDYASAVLGHRRLTGRVAAGVTDLEMYAQGGLASRIVDLPADAAVAKGVQIQVDGQPDQGISDELDRLGAMQALADALRWARLTGGGAIVLLADDGAQLRDPLDPKRLNQIQELRVFDLLSVTATEQRYGDPTKANFGQPEVYMVRVNAPIGDVNFFVHETRLIPVPGAALPRGATANPIPWAGRAAVSAAFNAVRRYRRGLTWADRLLERKQQAVYKMKGLAEAIKSDLEPVVQKRIAMVDTVRNVLNSVAVDAEDDYAILNMDMNGVKDTLGEFQVAVSSECGIPVTVLFGRSPAGMNSTGESDLSIYDDMVRGHQTWQLSPALERLVSLILAQSTYQGAPSSWSIAWNPLRSPSAKESADVRKTNADAQAQEMTALSAAMDAGLSEDEARAYLKDRGLYGLQADPTGDGRSQAAKYAAQTA
ncbi:phage portal protein [Achromobacter aloeverae]